MPTTQEIGTCFACLRKTQEQESIQCKSENCTKTYHLLCTNASNLTTEQRAVWTCPNCRVAAKKGGDNSSTPVRESSPVDTVTVRSKIRKNPSKISSSSQTKKSPGDQLSSKFSDIETLTSEIRLLRQDMQIFKSDFKAVVDALDLCRSRLDDVVTRLTLAETKIKVSEETHLKETNTSKALIAQLQQQVESQSQMLLRNEVEISGVEEAPNENPYHLALITAAKIGMQIPESELDFVYRAGARHTYDETKKIPHLPRPLVVRFTRKTLRDEFLKQARSRKSLNNIDIVGQAPERKVYINERLTRDKRLLFREARTQARESDFRYCWVKNGSIYIRKNSGSPGMLIQSSDDLQQLRGEQSRQGAKCNKTA